MRVWRGGAALDLRVRLSTPRQLVPSHSHDAKPQYLVYAGMVFTPLTVWYLKVRYGRVGFFLCCAWAVRVRVRVRVRARCVCRRAACERFWEVGARCVSSSHHD